MDNMKQIKLCRITVFYRT